MPVTWNENWKHPDNITTRIASTRCSVAIHRRKSVANPSFAALISTNPGGNRIAMGYISCPLQPDKQFARHTRRIVHYNVTAHPTAAWTLQQLREAIPSDHRYRFLIHDRDSIFSPVLDHSVSHMGLHVLSTPPRSPKAKSLCERMIGPLRRECLD
jgi:hypothetical protein